MHSARKAFTLIELLVVIAIIAILAAILFPVFAQAKNAAKKTADLSSMKQSGTALMMYATDSDDVMPIGGRPTYGPTGDWRWSTWRWWVQPYMKSGDVLGSASFKKGDYAPFVKNDYTLYEDWHHDLPLGLAGTNAWARSVEAPNGRNYSEIPRTAGFIAIVPSRFQFGDLGTWMVWKKGFDGVNDYYPGKGSFISYAGKSNFGFYDSHVTSMNPCSTFGALGWKPGDVPTEDYLWEWWSGPDPNVLRDWKQGAQPGYQPNDYGCQDIDAYR